MDSLLLAANAPEGSIVGRSFNQNLLTFLHNLQEVFPDEESLGLAIKALNLVNEDKPMDPLKGWLKSMKLLKEAGYEQPFFTECTAEKINCFMGLLPKMHPLLRMIPLENMWNDPGLLDEDRSCIWEHLSQLEMSSMTIDAFDPKAVSAIEALAKEYLSELNGLDPNTINVQSLGFDVIKRVMNDTRIREALADPSAEKRFAETFGENGEKFSLMSSSGQTAGLSEMMQAAMGGGNPGPLLQMMQNQPAMNDLLSASTGQTPDPAALLQAMQSLQPGVNPQIDQAALQDMLQQMGIGGALSADFLKKI